MFNAIDGHDGDVKKLTKSEQDKVISECYQCKLCYVKCPYVPPHEWNLDFPRLMMRANAIRLRNKESSLVERMSTNVLSRTDLVGSVSSATSKIANKAIVSPNTFSRKLMEKATGVSAQRQLPSYAKTRFSTWWKKRTPSKLTQPQSGVALFTTCFVEYMAPQVGKALVKVYEHNEVEVTCPAGTSCCGAPWLHSGNIEKFQDAARRNVDRLSIEVEQGRSIVIPEPTCAYVLKNDYPIYYKSKRSDIVAANTYDVMEYLIKLKKDKNLELKEDFKGKVPESVTYHTPCHLRAQNIGLKARDVLKLAGVKVNLVQECSGIDGTWGYKAHNVELSKKVMEPLARGIEKNNDSVIIGDCHLANTAIEESTNKRVSHPIEIVSQAYGFTED